MKKLFCILLLLIGFTIFSENKITIITQSDRVVATIPLNESEFIILNDQYLFLYVESKEYNFTFSGYPDGMVNKNGEIYYSKEVKLEGQLSLKDGYKPEDYKINVVLGFQTSDSDGISNIPVELSQEIVVKQSSDKPVLFVIISLFIIIGLVIIMIIRRKKS